MGFATATALAVGATSAIGAAKQSSAANKAAKQQQALTEQQLEQIDKSLEVQIGQFSKQAMIERLQRINEAQQIRGRLRVAGAETGTSASGSFLMLTRQASLDQELNLAIIQSNLEDMVQRAESDAEAARLNLQQNLAANIASIKSSVSNPLVAAFSGGLSGFSTGLQIQQAVNTTPGGFP